MSTKKTTIATYAHSIETIKHAINAGADHIIIDHPDISVRSWVEPENAVDIKTCIDFIKTYSKKIIISLNWDLIMHQTHINDCETLAASLKDEPIDYIRIQDSGFIPFLKNKLPTIKRVFVQEIGNANTASIDAFSQHVSAQQLSLDLTYKDVLAIQKKIHSDFEWLVQGPILIQHSQRRYLAGLEDEGPRSDRTEMIYRFAQDEDYPGRRFTFMDNPHGHFMYAYFDRCLLNYQRELQSLNLKTWIIDARGESLSYLKTACESYKTLRDKVLSVDESEALLTQLENEAKRPQKPGFFRANQTDRKRYQTYLPAEKDFQKVGRVCDVIKGKRIIVDCIQPISVGDTCVAFHPKISALDLPITKCWTMSGDEQTTSTPHTLIQIPWVKGIQQQAVLFIKNKAT